MGLVSLIRENKDRPILKAILTPFVRLNYKYGTILLNDKHYIKIMYFLKMGRKLNLTNPKTLNEKLQWLKLNDRTPLHTLCVDKIEVKKYITKKIGEEYVIPNLLILKNTEGLVASDLPEGQFIIKTNHDSGSYKIIRNKEDEDWEAIRRYFDEKLNKNYYRVSKEWQYKNISPKLLIEELLVSNDNNRLEDYKFECIHGKVEMINVDMNKDVVHQRNNYNTNWDLLPVLWPRELKNGKKIPKPKSLDKMIKLAEKLSEDFKFCRVDFYTLGEKIFFGEITFHPTSGFGRFLPDEWDLKMGEMLNLDKKG